MEVSEARGSYDTLKKRLDNSDTIKANKTITEKLQYQINVEKSRIDNLVKLPERKHGGRCRIARYKSWN